MVMIITMIINLFERENGNKQRIGKRVQMKKLVPIVWHPTKMQDWCMIGDQKKGIKEMVT